MTRQVRLRLTCDSCLYIVPAQLQQRQRDQPEGPIDFLS